ncbi:MAG: GntR family transcriptional regulator [Pseudomonadales bacterium]|nr:GntR family transcriptional regulator [Pseudomonadales bacterium]
MFKINPNAALPIYQQIVDQVRRQTASGQLQPGDPLPSVRNLAAEHTINSMTISKAYSQLEGEGLLERQRGKGMVIANSSQLANKKDRLKELEASTQQLALAARQLDLNTQDVVNAVTQQMERTDD